MKSIAQKKRYLQHEMTTKLHAVRLYREVKGVQYVPKVCCVGTDGDVFFQYTMIEEASRKRFIYAYKEQSSYSTVDFVKRAHLFRLCAADAADRQRQRIYPHRKNEACASAGFVLREKRHYAQDDPSSNTVA